jgi:manganese/zinc/iron transport system permease protein
MTWNDIIYFFSFQDSNISVVIIGCVLLSGLAAWIGTFTMLQKRALLGDAISHAVLPGVCLGFMLQGTKDPLWLMVGATVTGWLSILTIDGITKHSKIKSDTAIALVLSVFFGLGILLLTYIQHSGNAEQTGLEHFLFGKAASLSPDDLHVFGIVGFIIIIILLLFHRGFQMLSFDKEYGASIGFPIKTLQFLLSTCTVLTVSIGIQAMGVILMAALLITPATAARMWTNKLRLMIILSIIFGAFSGLFGAFVSYTAPSMPTGPWIVVIASVIVFVSVVIAPNKGVLALRRQKRKNRNKISNENLLKILYKHTFESDAQHLSVAKTELVDYFKGSQLNALVKKLSKSNHLFEINNELQLTYSGKKEAERIIRNHRLWELYLTTFVGMKLDHVHNEAEAMEHIITPAIEAELSILLDHPEKDPHNKNIPKI